MDDWHKLVSWDSWQPTRSPEVFLTGLGMAVANKLPTGITRSIVQYNSHRCTLVLSNLAGPQTELYTAGIGIEDLTWFLPLFHNVGLAIQVFSYNGKVRISLSCDRDLFEDPELLCRLFWESYCRLCQVA